MNKNHQSRRKETKGVVKSYKLKEMNIARVFKERMAEELATKAHIIKDGNIEEAYGVHLRQHYWI